MSKKDIIVQCPHCNLFIIIEEINCAIFRHGIFIKNNVQINPHSTKQECDNYVDNKLIIGCGKPFKLIKLNEEYTTIICDYI